MVDFWLTRAAFYDACQWSGHSLEATHEQWWQLARICFENHGVWWDSSLPWGTRPMAVHVNVFAYFMIGDMPFPDRMGEVMRSAARRRNVPSGRFQ